MENILIDVSTGDEDQIIREENLGRFKSGQYAPSGFEDMLLLSLSSKNRVIDALNLTGSLDVLVATMGILGQGANLAKLDYMVVGGSRAQWNTGSGRQFKASTKEEYMAMIEVEK